MKKLVTTEGGKKGVNTMKHFQFIIPACLVGTTLFAQSEAFSTTVSSTTTTSAVVSSSIGQRIQQATETAQLLDVAADLWLPTDDNLAPHLRTQRVHHEKRLRWSAQLLGKLGTITLATAADQNNEFWRQNDAFASNHLRHQV